MKMILAAALLLLAPLARAIDSNCTQTPNLSIYRCPSNSTDWYQSYTGTIDELDALARTAKSSFTVEGGFLAKSSAAVNGASGLDVQYGVEVGSLTIVSSATLRAGATLYVERPFTTSGSTKTIGATPTCDGFDCIVLSTTITDTLNYISFDGLKFTTQSYRLEGFLTCPHASGSCVPVMTVNNTSTTANGYSWRQEVRDSGARDQDDSSSDPTSPQGLCPLTFGTETFENSPQSYLMFKLNVLLVGKTMRMWGKTAWNENGSTAALNWSEMDVSCYFNGAVNDVGNIQSIQLKENGTSAFSGKARIFEENY
jgi:hypothetical protein